ncbi:hypothetical protein PHJA_002216400 [Phtheirospermum japonicum]|uniref:Uncharacterized protein n=1 Tax=Phtheirospermum japonicum TaxID=374723 RepID=A0A830CX59_9LAMI|nr:hypothetical protein PHJA_002216400 [Phtheirospermum japonicum]
MQHIDGLDNNSNLPREFIDVNKEKSPLHSLLHSISRPRRPFAFNPVLFSAPTILVRPITSNINPSALDFIQHLIIVNPSSGRRTPTAEIGEIGGARFVSSTSCNAAVQIIEMRVLRTTGDTRNKALFAIRCLTIAWKLRDKSFVLRSFLRERDILYSTEDVRQMELAICRGLE